MRRLWEHICAFVLGLMAGTVFLLAFYEPSRSWPAELLVRDDRPEKGADAIPHNTIPETGRKKQFTKNPS